MVKCFFCSHENEDEAKFCKNCGNPLPVPGSSSKSNDADLEMLNRYLFPKFIIERKIGKGGMATVYLGEQTSLQRKVVVKILNPEISQDEEIRERFLIEARTPAKLKHPNIVEVIDVGICEDRPYYIMEYAPGGSVLDKIKFYREKSKPYPLKEAIDMIVKVLDALHYCHVNNLQSHRDIKPANIMFRANGDPIIVDFGIAKVADSSITKTRMTMGTANYMSPEQCQGRKDIDGRSDVYSVGIMLFEILTGELPFKGDSGLSIMIKQVKEKLPSFSTTLKGKYDKTIIETEYSKYSKELENVIDKACAKSRKKRYQSAKEFAEALAKITGTQIKITPISNPIIHGRAWGLIFAMLLLGLGLGGLGVHRFFLKPALANNILLNTEPEGAQVIDGTTNKYVGLTPFKDTKHDPGVYTYKIIKDGYKEVQIKIELKDPKTPVDNNLVMEELEPVEEPAKEIPVEEKTKEIPEDKKEEVAPAKIVKPIPERDPRPMTTVNVAGLNWQARDIRRLNWYSAMTHCKNLGMRLPSKEQLQSALSTGSKSLNSPCCEYWTSTTHEEDADNAYNISTKSIENFFSSKSNVFYVRCVSK